MPRSWPEAGSCTSGRCQPSAGWRRRRERPLCERWCPAVGRRRDTRSSANRRNPSKTARSSAAAVRSTRSSRYSGVVWRRGRVCYRSSQLQTCQIRGSGFLIVTGGCFTAPVRWCAACFRMLCGTALAELTVFLNTGSFEICTVRRRSSATKY